MGASNLPWLRPNARDRRNVEMRNRRSIFRWQAENFRRRCGEAVQSSTEGYTGNGPLPVRTICPACSSFSSVAETRARHEAKICSEALLGLVLDASYNSDVESSCRELSSRKTLRCPRRIRSGQANVTHYILNTPKLPTFWRSRGFQLLVTTPRERPSTSLVW